MDRQDFLKTLAEACQKTGWQVHAYCLMHNHFHLVMETPEANLVAGMRWLLSSYTIRLNHRHKLPGHVFSGRYKALVVDGSGDGYLRTVCDYAHLNPVRVKLVSIKWIAARLHLGTFKGANANLHRWRQSHRESPGFSAPPAGLLRVRKEIKQ